MKTEFARNWLRFLRRYCSHVVCAFLLLAAASGRAQDERPWFNQRGPVDSGAHERAINAINIEITNLRASLDRLDRSATTTAQNTGNIEALHKQMDSIQQQIQNLPRDGGSASDKTVSLQISAIQTQITNLETRVKALEGGRQGGGETDKLPGNAEHKEPSPEANPSKPLAPGADLTGLRTNLNIVWTLVAGFLVMFMQAGFALVETGFVRKKNAAHTMAMNFMVYSLAMLGYWACGFAFQMGGAGVGHANDVHTLGPEIYRTLNGELFGVIGCKGFFLSGGEVLSGSIFTLFLFNMVFMDTAATIPTGAMAERWRFASFCLYAVAVGAFIYPVYANWVWGGGWLSALGRNAGTLDPQTGIIKAGLFGHGVVDFAGSSVVHLCGGTIAFVGARKLGERKDRYMRKLANHNVSFGVLGTFILAFGWFGFNAGSTLEGTTQIGVIATNTMLASAAGSVSAMLVTWWLRDKPQIVFMCNGMLGGLVAITAPCAFVSSWAAVLIGLVAGVWVVVAAWLLEDEWKLIDDPVGAVSVHGACGLWGIIALGIFANGTYGKGFNGVDGNVVGLFGGGLAQMGTGSGQLLAQAVGAVCCIGIIPFHVII